MAASLTRIASIPPTACTATTASTITMPILITNWNRSVTSTPHNPESVEIADVRAIMPTTIHSASPFDTPKILQLVFGVSKGDALWIVAGDHADDDPQRVALRHAEDQLQDLRHREVDPAEDDAVDEQAQVNGPEAPQEGGRWAGVADLRELDVGHDAGAAPQAGVEEHREHPAREQVPPQPVARDPVLRDQTGDDKGRVRGERGRHHRRARQPPRHVSPGEKELRRVLAGATLVVQPDGDVEQEVQGDDHPVGER